MDLLLHLIHKNEVDIFDIPISTITKQYLEYLDLMKSLNIDLAGDFFLMASTLMHIKSKMLLPEYADDEEAEDPRMELARPLLEYMRYKELAQDLAARPILDRDVFSRRIPGDVLSEADQAEEELNVSLFQLIDAFKQVTERLRPPEQLNFRLERWTVKQKTAHIMARLRESGTLFFSELFEEDRTVEECIVTFLALLEMVNIGLVKVFQMDPQSDIRVSLRLDAPNGEGDEPGKPQISD
ncbi:MAG: segregation/condensation protein A [Deltaproteobacteria bacterium]|nr:segregation/condensation protein A [Deltaproteobacteria bacterium]MBW1923444.1 segregation/condensation protein A [Deltaproteobacteria bacterium]MBW1950785.1 segregation/condensation protein A [Deltaproteobacteria bacterium]MBW2008952.1 segregation/condensation protein A [Deltaproteobacteria bacterium]MBW2347286.1 segregation/condensation protein A [Deltaproteobacteria bacterium]